MDREELLELLPLYVLDQVSTPERTQIESALERDGALRDELEQLRAVLLGLHFAPAPAELPPGSLDRLLERARTQPFTAQPFTAQPFTAQPFTAQPPTVQTLSAPVPIPARFAPRRTLWPWLSAGLGLAAALGVLLLLRPATPPTSALVSASDAAVVVSSGESVVFASNVSGMNAIAVRDPSGRVRPVWLGEAKTRMLKSRMHTPFWFTEGVSSGDRVYLSCGANGIVLVIDVRRAEVVGLEAAPTDVAGMSVSAGKLWMKGAASAELRVLERGVARSDRVAPATSLPQTEFMDAVLAWRGQVWVTHHASGTLLSLDPQSRAVTRRRALGGAPVALAVWQDRLLVADVNGRMLWLDPAGRVVRTLPLGGNPDKIAVQGKFAYLSDRSGPVFQVDLERGTLERTVRFEHPMDLAALPGGGLALADGVGGLKMLSADLRVLEQVGQSSVPRG